MNWLLTKLNKRLLKLGLLAGVLVLVWFGLRLGEVNQTFAATGINTQLNYQGKLNNADGTSVADGTYSLKFVIYDASSGGFPLSLVIRVKILWLLLVLISTQTTCI